MKDIEEKVSAMKVVGPSTELDRRIARLFSEADTRARPASFAQRNIPLWACAAACGVALSAGLFLGRSTVTSDPQTADPTPLIYVIDGGELVRGNVFDWTIQEDRFFESTSGKDIHVAIFPAPEAG